MKKLTRVLMTTISLFLMLSGAFSVPAAAATKETVDDIIDSIPAEWPRAPEISAEAAILMDADSGEILYAKNATKSMYPASTTKLITGLLTVENCGLQDIVEFSPKAVNIPSGSSHIGMRRYEKMELKECLYGLLLPSANEVANALAEHVSGSISDFVIAMNERAGQLGAVNTSFTNANGLHDENHFTCAYDLARIMKACAANETFVSISSEQSYVHHADELLPKDIPMTNTNLMIRPSSEYYNEYVVCGKTGHTDESGYNLVIYAEKDNMRLISVVMGCEDGDQYISTQSLLDYGFNYFKKVLPAELDTSLALENAFTNTPLALPLEKVSLLSINASDSILLPDAVTFDMLSKTVEKSEEGLLITYTYEGYPLGSVTLTEKSETSNPLFKEKEYDDSETDTVENIAALDGYVLLSIAGLTLLLVFVIFLMAFFILPKKKLGKVTKGKGSRSKG